MDTMTFARAALASYFTFIAVFYTAKLMALRARTGRRHADVGAAGTAQWVSHRLFALLRAAIWLFCVVRVAQPGLDGWILPIQRMTTIPVIATGLALLLVSLAGVVYIHSYLGEAWRSGVAASGPAALITTGPYGQVRHPLFLAIGIGQVGFFLSLPSLFSLACLGLGVAALVLQGRYEERRMSERFGGAWRAYAARTPAVWPMGGPGLPTGGIREG